MINIHGPTGKILKKYCLVRIEENNIDKNALKYNSNLNVLIISYSAEKNHINLKVSLK